MVLGHYSLWAVVWGPALQHVRHSGRTGQVCTLLSTHLLLCALNCKLGLRKQKRGTLGSDERHTCLDLDRFCGIWGPCSNMNFSINKNEATWHIWLDSLWAGKKCHLSQCLANIISHGVDRQYVRIICEGWWSQHLDYYLCSSVLGSDYTLYYFLFFFFLFLRV